MGIPSISVDLCFGKGWSTDLTSFTEARTCCKYRIYKVHSTPLMYDANNFIKKGRWGIRFCGYELFMANLLCLWLIVAFLSKC